MSSKPPSSPQGATEGPNPSLPLADREEEGEALLALAKQMFPHLDEIFPYMEKLAGQLADWQHQVFNASHNHPNRVGLSNVSHEMQIAAYELHVLLGYSAVEAKLGARMTLSPEEAQAEKDKMVAAQGKAAVAEFQRGLHPSTSARPVHLQSGRQCDR